MQKLDREIKRVQALEVDWDHEDQSAYIYECR